MPYFKYIYKFSTYHINLISTTFFWNWRWTFCSSRRINFQNQIMFSTNHKNRYLAINKLFRVIIIPEFKLCNYFKRIKLLKFQIQKKITQALIKKKHYTIHFSKKKSFFNSENTINSLGINSSGINSLKNLLYTNIIYY